MSGILRNLIAFIRALFSWGDSTPQSRVITHFRMTPFDAGLHVLKSDKVLQLGESARARCWTPARWTRQRVSWPGIRR